MKTLIKPLLLALSLGIVTTANSFAETNPGSHPKVVATYKTGIYMTSNGKLVLALDKEKGGSVTINLKSANGSVLFSKYIGKNEQLYRTRLNLSELEDGVYQVEITNGVDVTTQNVTISTKQPTTPDRLISIK